MFKCSYWIFTWTQNSLSLGFTLLLLVPVSTWSLFWAWLLASALWYKMTIVPLQVAGAPLVTATTTAVSSVLLAPSVFQQTVTRSSDLERKASSPSPLTIGTPESQRKPSIILSKSQLQDTLIHLIKNDSSFLSTLHEVYLQVLTKNKDNHNLWLEQSKSKGRVLTSETNRLHHGNFWAEHRVWESWNWAYEKETHFLRMFSKWHSQW